MRNHTPQLTIHRDNRSITGFFFCLPLNLNAENEKKKKKKYDIRKTWQWCCNSFQFKRNLSHWVKSENFLGAFVEFLFQKRYYPELNERTTPKDGDYYTQGMYFNCEKELITFLFTLVSSDLQLVRTINLYNAPISMIVYSSMAW